MIKEYLNSLSVRERSLISIMLGLLVLVLLYMAVYRPIVDARDESARILRNAEAVYSTVKQAVVAVSSRQGSEKQTSTTTENTQPIRIRVAVAARENNVSVSRIQPDQQGNLTLWIENVSTQDFYVWLTELYSKDGIKPSKVSLQKNGTGDSLRAQVQFSEAR